MKTNHFFFSFFFCLFLTLPTFAQKVGIGFKAGVNSVTTNDTTTVFTRLSFVGLNFGGYGYFKFNKFLALQAELNYLEHGRNLTILLQEVNSNGTVIAVTETKITERYAYLQIPLLLRGQVDAKKFKFWGNAGLYGGLFLGGNYNIDYRIASFIPSLPTSGSLKNITAIEWGLAGGLGAGYKLGIGYLTVDARYTYGLSGIAETTPPNYAAIQHRNFIGNLGYLIEL